MSFRVNLPLENARNYALAAADGQMGTILKFYRDWQLSGDNAFLEKYWNNVKNALAFSWIEGGWDANADGVMEGCQHNTMDVEYFGPNPQMQLWYLGALKAGKEMALVMKENNFADKCDKLFKQGSIWTDKNLFNGEYYEQIIMPPEKSEDIASGLSIGMGSNSISDPDFQLAKGCLVDQLVGQYMAHICGLGYLVKPENVKTTLNSIMKYNYRESLNEHFNNMRSYAMGDESALLMASWASVLALTGFHYSAVNGTLSFADIEGTYFWSNGYTYGNITIQTVNAKKQITINTLGGKLELKNFELAKKSNKVFDKVHVVEEGDELKFEIDK